MSIGFFDYQDTKFGIKLKYPEFLEPISPTKNNRLLQFLTTKQKLDITPFPMSIKIDKGLINPGQTLDEIWDYEINEALLNGRIVYESKYITISGSRGRMIRYGNKPPYPSNMIIDAMTIKNNISYLFGFEWSFISWLSNRIVPEGIEITNNVIKSIAIL
jgi:hypothetical protein